MKGVTTEASIGPGAYNFKLPQDLTSIKKRNPTDKPLAFGSGAARNINQLDAR